MASGKKRKMAPLHGKTVRLLGVNLHPLSIPGLTGTVARIVEDKEKHIIACHNLHTVYLHHRDRDLRRYYQRASVTHFDGMSLVFWARLLGEKVDRSHRITFLDLYPALFSRAAANGWSVFYLGSRPEIASRGEELLQRMYPGLKLRCYHGYFNRDIAGPENQAVRRMIRASAPNLLLVGMGTPLQEKWIDDNIDDLPVNVTMTVGSSMEYITGADSLPPRWSGSLGLEWLFRMMSNPRRLWRRHCIEPWYLFRYGLEDLRQSRSSRA